MVKVEDDPNDPVHANRPPGVSETVVVQEEVVLVTLQLIRKNTVLAGTSNIQVMGGMCACACAAGAGLVVACRTCLVP
jgi:hypothetical protein